MHSRAPRSQAFVLIFAAGLAAGCSRASGWAPAFIDAPGPAGDQASGAEGEQIAALYARRRYVRPERSRDYADQEAPTFLRRALPQPVTARVAPEQLQSRGHALQTRSGHRLQIPPDALRRIGPDGRGLPLDEDAPVELEFAVGTDSLALAALAPPLAWTPPGADAESPPQLLESGGMIYVNAVQKGEPLVLDPETPLNLELPAPPQASGAMGLYFFEEGSPGGVAAGPRWREVSAPADADGCVLEYYFAATAPV